MQIDEQRPLKCYNNKTYYCPISLAMDLVGEKWKGGNTLLFAFW